MATGWGAQEFNAALLVLLPKGAPAATDNRLLAQAVRLRVEPLLARGASSLQRGFLPGRSMLENLAEIDTEMQTTSHTAEEGGAVFYDFAAAFPWVDRGFLRDSLRSAGLPPAGLRGGPVLGQLLPHRLGRWMARSNAAHGRPSMLRGLEGTQVARALDQGHKPLPLQWVAVNRNKHLPCPGGSEVPEGWKSSTVVRGKLKDAAGVCPDSPTCDCEGVQLNCQERSATPTFPGIARESRSTGFAC